MASVPNSDKTGITVIVVISIAVFLVVTLLAMMSGINIDLGFDIYVLPKFHAIINSLVAFALLVGLIFIKQKRVTWHRVSMAVALFLSVIFLASYVIYHAVSEPTSFGGTGFIVPVYYFILITHIVLAAFSLPFILLTVYRAFRKDFAKHRKLARYVWPVWFYVAVTGVVVYLMISPYYG